MCSRPGEEAWETIKRKAGVTIDAFVGMVSYPDDVTYELVAVTGPGLSVPVCSLAAGQCQGVPGETAWHQPMGRRPVSTFRSMPNRAIDADKECGRQAAANAV